MRFHLEKFLEGSWVLMASLSAPDRLTSLCEAFGGQVRVIDLRTEETIMSLELP